MSGGDACLRRRCASAATAAWRRWRVRAQGHTVSPNTVRKLLPQLGYSRQANRKANDGRHHADRDAQFEHINTQVRAFQASDQPVISADTKKIRGVHLTARGQCDGGGPDQRAR
jgi:hypothetical protein